LNSHRGGRPETLSSCTEIITSLQNNLLLETIKNLSKEIGEMHTTMNSLATNRNTLHHQNHELNASRERKERDLLRIGSSQAQACSIDTTSPATNANKVPPTELRLHYNHSDRKNPTKSFAKTIPHWPKPGFFNFTPSFQRARGLSHHFYNFIPWH
jgi:hypothetical protein